MDNARRGEIALLALKHMVRNKGIHLNPDFRREVGNAAKAIGIPFEEAMEFIEELYRELIEDMFAKKGDPTETTVTRV